MYGSKSVLCLVLWIVHAMIQGRRRGKGLQRLVRLHLHLSTKIIQLQTQNSRNLLRYLVTLSFYYLEEKSDEFKNSLFKGFIYGHLATGCLGEAKFSRCLRYRNMRNWTSFMFLILDYNTSWRGRPVIALDLGICIFPARLLTVTLSLDFLTLIFTNAQGTDPSQRFCS